MHNNNNKLFNSDILHIFLDIPLQHLLMHICNKIKYVICIHLYKIISKLKWERNKVWFIKLIVITIKRHTIIPLSSLYIIYIEPETV